MRKALVFILVLAGLLVAPGCQTMDVITKAGAAVGVATGTISADQAQSLQRVAGATGKLLERITPEQEYYIGRTVTASILAEYPAFDQAAANAYLNLLGQSLAMASDRPETFAGYHFLVMDTGEINAFAAPGGFILVSRGLLRCCRSEDAVAAVLAHEIGHVQHMHGLQAIGKSRLTSALTILGAEAAKNLGGADLAKLTESFEGAIGDITGTLVNSGYSRKFEGEADLAAVTLLARVGYSPAALKDMLDVMAERMNPQEAGFAKTHPSPADRLAAIAPQLATAAPIASPPPRTARFTKALKGI